MRKGLTRRPYSDHGVARELALYPIAFQGSSYGDSLRSHCAFMALTMHTLRVHDVCTALTACYMYRRSDISKDAVQSQCKRYGPQWWLLNVPCARPRRFYCIVGDLTPCLWRQYGNPIARF